jgi:hypothetical protein
MSTMSIENVGISLAELPETVILVIFLCQKSHKCINSEKRRVFLVSNYRARLERAMGDIRSAILERLLRFVFEIIGHFRCPKYVCRSSFPYRVPPF